MTNNIGNTIQSLGLTPGRRRDNFPVFIFSGYRADCGCGLRRPRAAQTFIRTFLIKVKSLVIELINISLSAASSKEEA